MNADAKQQLDLSGVQSPMDARQILTNAPGTSPVNTLLPLSHARTSTSMS